jgi:hypothetical protein
VLFGGDRFDGFVGLQTLGVEALDDGAVGWSTPWAWLGSRCRAALASTLTLSTWELQI